MCAVSHHTLSRQSVDQPVSPQQSQQTPLPAHTWHAFSNPFQLEDLLIFDQEDLHRVLVGEVSLLTPVQLAWSMNGAPSQLIRRVLACMPVYDQPAFLQELTSPGVEAEIAEARHLLLDCLFWELTYWKTPELYEELTAGEYLHPGIFAQLEPWIRNKMVLDIGAGSGRATFEAVRYGARRVYAIEPSPGLRQILRRKATRICDAQTVIVCAGDLARIPLPAQSVDLVLACSTFTPASAHGGEPALAELQRVVNKGGVIVVIWPGEQGRAWLSQHGFRYVSLPCDGEMSIAFPSWQSAWRCVQRFYGKKARVLRYLRRAPEPRIPFSVLGCSPPCDYCWRRV